MKNICFSGAGVKGICYIGVYKYLIEKGMLHDLENLSGSSAGAIICLFILLKYTVEELEILIEKITPGLLEDFDVENIIRNYSIDRGRKVEMVIRQIIISKGFSGDITFAQLHALTGINLHVCVTRLNDCSRFIFNSQNTPDFKVYKACKYSMNIPFIWSSKDIDGMYFADGCLSSNLPISDFKCEDTLGITCNSEKIKQEITGFASYITRSIECSMNRADLFEIESYRSNGYRIITVQLQPISSVDFGISKETKTLMVKLGYDSCCSQFKA